MKIKLHNKFEISLRGKTYTAYNTLLKTVYDKLYKLEEFTSHLAIGTGLINLTFEDSKLTNYLKTLPTETEDIQCDITKGTLYIKKTCSIKENELETFSFSELGLTDSSEFDPTIYNHVLMTDSDGNPISITRNIGDAMTIRITIYLELSNQNSGLFVSGDNELIKQLLGENLNNSDHNLYAIRGNNLTENKQIYRTTPDLTESTICERNINYNSDGSISINFLSELGSGEIEEALLCYNNKVVLRLNALEIKTPTTSTESFTSTQSNIIEVGKSIKEITNVEKNTQDGTVTETNYSIIKYSKQLTDKLEDLFEQTFTAHTPRYISTDGKSIAFVLNSYIHLYVYEDYSFKKINTINMLGDNIFKIKIFDNTILLLRTTAPYISIFKIINNTAIQQEVNIQVYDNSSYSYNWLDADAVQFKNGTIKIGFIQNNEEFSPIVVTLKPNSLGIYYDTIQRPQLPTTKKVYSIQNNSFCEPVLAFITDSYEGGEYYFIEHFYESFSALKDSSEAEFQLLNNSNKIWTAGRAVLSEKNTAPFLKVYYYPNFESLNNNDLIGIKHYTSNDGNYIAIKYEDGSFKIFNFHNINSLEEFESNISSFINQNEINDLDFVGNILLIFTQNNVLGIALKNAYTRIDNISDNTASYLVSYSKYNLLGSQKLEGVQLDLTFTFNKTLE